jgi:hypothetical protein
MPTADSGGVSSERENRFARAPDARAGRGLRPPAGRDGDTQRAALNVDLGSLMDISERTLL